ncbi:MAG: alanine racemase [Sphingomonas fennica]
MACPPPPAEAIAAARLTIDLAAVAANYRLIAARAAPAAVGGVVKADGYGLGAERIAAVLAREGCRDFFVATLDEAIALAPALAAEARLFVLNGLVRGAEGRAAAIGAIPVLNSVEQVADWAAAAPGRAAAIQIDSGMSRLGLSPGDALALAGDARRMAALNPLLLMSHLAAADVPGAAANAAQAARFAQVAAAFPGVPRSLANSGGVLLGGLAHDLVRPGIALYGGAPQAGPNPMRGVVTLEARIVQLRDVGAGTGVGYGLDWVAARPSRIATVGVGYADGWPRALGNVGAVAIGGRRVPIVGRVSMDSMTLDVTDVDGTALAGDFPVQLIGPDRPLDAVAAEAGTIAYEILTRAGPRYARRYRGDGADGAAPADGAS